jgi:Endonuclease V
VLLVNATGRDHPRRAGLALQLWFVLDLPTVGLTHCTLLAAGEWPPDEPGARAPLLLAGERVGYWLRSKAGARPLAVHAAWRIDPEAAAEVVLATTGWARTPEPLGPRPAGGKDGARTGVSCRHVATGSNKEDAMADTVQRVDYLYVTVPDTHGEGIRILAALREKRLNLLAYLGFPAGDGQSQIDLVADDAGALRQAVEEIGLSASETSERS